MTFQEIQTAIFRRGFEDLNDAGQGVTDVKRWANQTYKEVVRAERWPFRRASTSGAAPLTISDIGPIESVQDTTQNSISLSWRDRRDLLNAYSDLTTTGSARWFYVDNGVVRTWPVGGTLSVTYYKVPASMSANGDTPIIPEDYHDIIVTGAVKKAHMARSNYEAAGAEQAEYDRVLQEMRDDLLDDQDVSSDLISVTAGSSDW